MKSKLNTPALRLAEIKRLAIAFHELSFDMGQLVHHLNDGIHDDEEINKAMGDAGRLIERLAGRLLMTGGMASDEWYDRRTEK